MKFLANPHVLKTPFFARKAAPLSSPEDPWHLVYSPASQLGLQWMEITDIQDFRLLCQRGLSLRAGLGLLLSVPWLKARSDGEMGAPIDPVLL